MEILLACGGEMPPPRHYPLDKSRHTAQKCPISRHCLWKELARSLSNSSTHHTGECVSGSGSQVEHSETHLTEKKPTPSTPPGPHSIPPQEETSKIHTHPDTERQLPTQLGVPADRQIHTSTTHNAWHGTLQRQAADAVSRDTPQNGHPQDWGGVALCRGTSVPQTAAHRWDGQ